MKKSKIVEIVKCHKTTLILLAICAVLYGITPTPATNNKSAEMISYALNSTVERFIEIGVFSIVWIALLVLIMPFFKRKIASPFTSSRIGAFLTKGATVVLGSVVIRAVAFSWLSAAQKDPKMLLQAQKDGVSIEMAIAAFTILITFVYLGVVVMLPEMLKGLNGDPHTLNREPYHSATGGSGSATSLLEKE